MFSIRLPYSLCVATLLALNTAGVMRATLITYDAEAAWTAATNAFQTIDFDVTSSFVSFSDGTGYFYSPDVQFLGILTDTPATYFLYVVDPAAAADHDHGSGDVLKGPAYLSSQPDRRIQVNIPGGVTSFAVDLMTYNALGVAGPQAYTIRLSTGDEITGVSTLAQPDRKFFGVTSTDTITQVEFVLTSGTVDTFDLIDNFRYGDALTVAETPEAGSYFLVGTGLLAVALLRRRRTRSSDGGRT